MEEISIVKEVVKAGKIAKKAMNYALSKVKEGIKVLDLVESVESYILELGGKPAFPVNVSINEIAAHYTPSYNDNTILKEGDVVKIDIGVHVDGWIADTARTIEIGDSKYEKLIKASEEALENASKMLKLGVKVREIGKVIEETLRKYGYKPIYNLYGHQIDRWILHSKITIPNYDNGSEKKIIEGVYAIEPFATEGVGYVKDYRPSGIFSLQSTRPVRDLSAKRIFEYILREYKTLPFAKRWIIKKFGVSVTERAINLLKRSNIVYEYPILIERSGKVVVQTEHTYFVSRHVLTITDMDMS